MSLHDRLIEQIGAADGEPVSSHSLGRDRETLRALAELVREGILERAGIGLYRLSRPGSAITPSRSGEGRRIRYNPQSKRPPVSDQVRELVDQGMSDAEIH